MLTVVTPKTVLPGSQLTLSQKPFLDMVAHYRNAVERSPSGKRIISNRRAPSGNDLPVLEARIADIAQGLAPSPSETVKRRLSKLFLMFPVAGQNAEMIDATLDAYAGVMSAFPLWAVDSACRKVIASGATFRPSAPEMRTLAEKECAPVYQEAEALHDILTAEVYEELDKNERERVKSGFKDLLADLTKHTNPDGFRKTKSECLRDVEAGFPSMREPIAPSDRIARSLGLTPDARAEDRVEQTEEESLERMVR